MCDLDHPDERSTPVAPLLAPSAKGKGAVTENGESAACYECGQPAHVIDLSNNQLACLDCLREMYPPASDRTPK